MERFNYYNLFLTEDLNTLSMDTFTTVECRSLTEMK